MASSSVPLIPSSSKEMQPPQQHNNMTLAGRICPALGLLVGLISWLSYRLCVAVGVVLASAPPSCWIQHCLGMALGFVTLTLPFASWFCLQSAMRSVCEHILGGNYPNKEALERRFELGVVFGLMPFWNQAALKQEGDHGLPLTMALLALLGLCYVLRERGTERVEEEDRTTSQGENMPTVEAVLA